MKAAVCRAWGGPESLRIEEMPSPGLRAGHVRLGIRAAGIAFQDGLMVAGKYQTRPGFPFCPGNEVCGVVSEVGAGVEDLRPGDRVMALLPFGGYAEEAVLPEGAALKVPDRIDDAEAAVVAMAYGTAYQGLVDRAQIKAGEYLLVRGAGGGVGLAAVQLGAAFGAKVIAAASTPARRERALAAGARHVLDPGDAHFRDALLEMTGSHGADVVFDTIGSQFREQVLRCIGWRGRILIVGFAGGEIPQIPAHYILNKFCSIGGVFWGRAYFDREPEAYRAALANLVELHAAGAIRPLISRRVPLEGAPEALGDLMRNRIDGRAVIVFPPA